LQLVHADKLFDNLDWLAIIADVIEDAFASMPVLQCASFLLTQLAEVACAPLWMSS
jgi:hypothetical protein